MNRRVLALVILCIACAILAPCCREAPAESISLNGFEVLLSEPKVQFPASITFDIEAESDASISRLTLQYQVQKSLSLFPVTSVVFPEFVPASKIRTSWRWDMTETGGLPPGAELSYWWAIEDVEGDRIETPVASLSFDDERYSWHGLKEGNVSLLWYQGSDSFAGQLMTAAQEALERLAADIGADLQHEATIYVYASNQDLASALIFPQEWTGGVAFAEFGTVAIGISPGNLDWGRRAIAHELAHLVIHQVTFGGYGVRLPTWLDEGLAVYAEGKLDFEMQFVLVQAIARDSLLSVQTLCSPFSAVRERASLSYAQSYSLVEYLISQQGGEAKMSEFLKAFREGSGHSEALAQVYGLTIDKLDAQWREYAARK